MGTQRHTGQSVQNTHRLAKYSVSERLANPNVCLFVVELVLFASVQSVDLRSPLVLLRRSCSP